MPRSSWCLFCIAVLVLTVGACGGDKKKTAAAPTPAVSASSADAAVPTPPPPVSPTAPSVEAPDASAAPTPAPQVAAAPPATPTPVIAAGVDAALKGASDGCVGVTRDGTHALVLHDTTAMAGGLTRTAYWIVAGEGTEDDRTQVATCTPARAGAADLDCTRALAAATVGKRADLLAMAAGKALVACRSTTTRGKDDGLVAKPLGTRVVVSDGSEISFDGERSVELVAVDPVDAEDGASMRVDAVYWADGVGSVFAIASSLSPAPKEEDDPEEVGGVLTLGVTASQLGIAPCLPRPTSGRKVQFEPSPLDLASADDTPGCVAMTRDGRAALFVTEHVDAFADAGEGDMPADGDAADEGLEVQWFGAGPHPKLDTICVLETCGEAKRKALTAAALAAGLVACREASAAVIVDGFAFALRQAKGSGGLWLHGASPAPRWVHELQIGAMDGEDHEALVAIHQHQAGGPVFLHINNEDTGLRETRVRTLSDTDLGFCPTRRP